MSRRAIAIIVPIQVALVVGALVAIRSGKVPLGVPGEWEWLRVAARPEASAVLVAAVAVLGYAGFAVAGVRRIGAGRRALPWLLALLPMAIAVQAAIQEAAPTGYGLAKWAIALHAPGSSGYYTVARNQIRDLPAFLRAYPAWIKGQDSLHVGTHPPGLFVLSWASLRAMEGRPRVADGVLSCVPATVGLALRSLLPGRVLPPADRASLALTGALTLLTCAATLLPIYALARAGADPSSAWAAAVLWPLATSALIFQPAADTAFPLLSATALALAIRAPRSTALAVLAGIVLAIGTQLSLVFFPIGLIAALIYATDPGRTPRRLAIALVATGAGFLAVTGLFWAISGADPTSIWRTNAANHARFYAEYPRTYLAWVAENPVELAVGLGLPTVAWLVAGDGRWPRVAWITLATLAGLTLSGKNLSEVGRLWLPMMPAFLPAAGVAIRASDRPAIGLGATIVLLGLQAVGIESMIQVVYPITPGR